MKFWNNAFAVAFFSAGMTPLHANTIELQNATATFSQNGSHSVARSIDGIVDQTGWAVFPEMANQTAVFETTTDVGFASGSDITITLVQVFGSNFTIGSFKLALTTDSRDTFADGLSSAGDVSANWQNITPTSATSANGASFSQDAAGKLLVGGINPSSDTYTITARTTLTSISGIRLEVFTDSSLPSNGPGRSASGNFVLSEITATISPVPEPATTAMLVLGVIALTGFSHYRRRSKAR